LAPFFRALDYSLDITIQEFYEKTGIEFHIFVTEINALECIDISYKTHGDWTVVDAVYASCSLPFIFSPIIRDDKCYVDGSLLMNYPLIKCIEAVEDKRQILSVLLSNKIRPTVELVQQVNVTENSNFFDYMMVLVQRFLHNRVFISDTSVEVPYQVYLSAPEFTLDYIDLCMRSPEERRAMIDEGTETMRKWIEELTTNR
jgi:predicted acylesterase/phospholipase RssA